MTAERWRTFSKSEQLLALGAEFERARVWEKESREGFVGALERALVLIDLSLDDPKWKGDTLQLFALRDEAAKFYSGEKEGDVAELYKVL